MATLYRFRLKGYEVLNSILPQPQAALLSGILLGLDQDLPDDLVLAFQETGTAHIIAISGFNIAIISAFFFWLFRLLVPAGRLFSSRSWQSSCMRCWWERNRRLCGQPSWEPWPSWELRSAGGDPA